MGEESVKQITEKCAEVRDILIERNKQYGDSFKSPVNIFSKLSAIDTMCAVTDIKLTRLHKGVDAANQRDTVIDTIGSIEF